MCICDFVKTSLNVPPLGRKPFTILPHPVRPGCAGLEGPGAPGHPPALAQCGSIWRGLRVPSWGFPLRPGGAVLPQTHISTSWLPQNSPRSLPPLRCGDPDPFTGTWGGPALPASLAPSQPYTFCRLPKFLTLQVAPRPTHPCSLGQPPP